MPCLLNIGCGHTRHPDWINMDVAGPPDVIARDAARGIPFRAGAFDAVYHSHMLEHLPRQAVPGFLADCLRVLKPGGVLRVAVPDLEGAARAYLLALEQAAQGDPEAASRHEWMVVELVDQLCRHAPGGEMRAFWLRDPVPARGFVEARLGAEAARAIRELQAARDAGRLAPPASASALVDPCAVGAFRLGGECHLWMYDRISLAALLRRAGFERVETRAHDQSDIPGFHAYGLDTLPEGGARKPDSLFMEAVKPLSPEARS